MINTYVTSTQLKSLSLPELVDGMLIQFQGRIYLFKNGEFFSINYVENGEIEKDRRTKAEHPVRVVGFYRPEFVRVRENSIFYLIHPNPSLVIFANGNIGLEMVAFRSVIDVDNVGYNAYMYYDNGLKVFWGFRDNFSEDENFGDPRGVYHCTRCPTEEGLCDPFYQSWNDSRVEYGYYLCYFGTTIEGVEKNYK